MNADEIQALLDAAPQNLGPATSVAVLNEPDETEQPDAQAESSESDDSSWTPEFGAEEEPAADLSQAGEDPPAAPPTDTAAAAPAAIAPESIAAAAPAADPTPVVAPTKTTPDESPAPVAAASSTPAPVVAATLPMWIKLTTGGTLVLSIAATSLGFINRSVLESEVDRLEIANASLNDRCDFQQTLCQRLMGNPGDRDRPFWDARPHVLDLDQAFLAQIPTQVGDVNVIRTRPTSLNDRGELNFEITNPNALTLHRGQLIIRTSDQPHDPSRAYDYDALRAWQKTVTTKTYELGELPAGQTRQVLASVQPVDDSDELPKYVDFEIVFGYYSTTGDSSPLATSAN
ncbi:hypothetical protein CA51_48110 [Rosistilla oblonga]|uniref:hypothetical protein n=1 Tax=Rosistilla oblonga TaxID=2527990 RepID=UPI00118A1971|nr:hypothetical protein [Rosistilla oblonga]QDV14901.1 hypothetical protein CA51_48110 [Rosistilla oblonga]